MSDNFELDGIVTAIVTPFTADLSAVDERALRAVTRFQLDAGVGGIIPAGSTGEFSSLTNAERKRVTEVVVEEVGGAVPVIPHTGAITTAETIDLSLAAQGAGADAVMVMPPYYEPHTWLEVLGHYQALSDAIDIPIMYYHMPAASHHEPTLEQFAQLADIENVRFVKDSSGNAVQAGEIQFLLGDRITHVNGEDKLTMQAFAAGGRASVWGSATFYPSLAVELYTATAVRKDLDEANAVWRRIWPIMVAIGDISYQSAVKAGLELVGVPAGVPRLPMAPAPRAYTEKLASILRDSGVALAGDEE